MGLLGGLTTVISSSSRKGAAAAAAFVDEPAEAFAAFALCGTTTFSGCILLDLATGNAAKLGGGISSTGGETTTAREDNGSAFILQVHEPDRSFGQCSGNVFHRGNVFIQLRQLDLPYRCLFNGFFDPFNDNRGGVHRLFYCRLLM